MAHLIDDDDEGTPTLTPNGDDTVFALIKSEVFNVGLADARSHFTAHNTALRMCVIV